jgi:hypothetical protein
MAFLWIGLASDTQRARQRRHVRLTATEAGLEVEELGSTNGTFAGDVLLRREGERATLRDARPLQLAELLCLAAPRLLAVDPSWPKPPRPRGHATADERLGRPGGDPEGVRIHRMSDYLRSRGVRLRDLVDASFRTSRMRRRDPMIDPRVIEARKRQRHLEVQLRRAEAEEAILQKEVDAAVSRMGQAVQDLKATPVKNLDGITGMGREVEVAKGRLEEFSARKPSLETELEQAEAEVEDLGREAADSAKVPFVIETVISNLQRAAKESDDPDLAARRQTLCDALSVYRECHPLSQTPTSPPLLRRCSVALAQTIVALLESSYLNGGVRPPAFPPTASAEAEQRVVIPSWVGAEYEGLSAGGRRKYKVEEMPVRFRLFRGTAYMSIYLD